MDPWAVVVRHGRWYLLCHSHRADAIRTYRIDRITGVEQTGDAFVPPDGPRPGGRAGGEPRPSAGSTPPGSCFDAPSPRWRRGSGHRWAGSSATGDGCVLRRQHQQPADVRRRSGWPRVPFPFRVEGGPELRSAMAALVARLAESIED